MQIARRMNRIRPSGTIAIAEKARMMQRSNRKIFRLDVGEPDFDTPKNIKNAAIKAIKNGLTNYTSSKGLIELRQAISLDLKKRNIKADPETEIVVTPGTKHALYCACLATLDPFDQVLVLSPTWPTHIQCIEMAKAKPVEIPCGSDYNLDEEYLKNRINKKSKMILLSSPNNPTGGVISTDEMKVIVELAKDHNLLIISDEVYDRIIYDNFESASPASLSGGQERTITLNGFSKAYAMTGWRIGYASSTKECIDAITKIQQSTTTCPVSFVQKAAFTALTESQISVEKMIVEYDKRRKFILRHLREIPGIRCTTPRGSFYVFPDISQLGLSSSEYCEALLEEESVSTTPGSVFGKGGEGHIRISYAVELSTISTAIEKIEKFSDRLLMKSNRNK